MIGFNYYESMIYMCAPVLYNDEFKQKIKILLLYINYIDYIDFLGGGGGDICISLSLK